MMEILDLKYGVAGIVVLLGLHLVMSVVKFLWGEQKKITKGSEQQLANIELSLAQIKQFTQEIRIKIELLEREIVEIGKLKADVQKVFSAVKIIAGSKWPEVRKKLTQDNLP